MRLPENDSSLGLMILLLGVMVLVIFVAEVFAASPGASRQLQRSQWSNRMRRNPAWRLPET